MRYVTLLVLLLANHAAAQCFSGGSYKASFSYPAHQQVYHAPAVVHHAVPYVAPVVKDHAYPASFAVTYNVAFPPAAATGNTVYGYNGPQNYAFLDPAGWLSAASRYNETAQLAATKGFAEFNDSAKFVFGQQHTLLEQQSRIALLAEVSKLLANTKAGGSAAVELRAVREESGGVKIASAPIQDRSADVAAIFKTNCTGCHNPTKLEGKLDLTDLSKLDAKYEDKIVERLLLPVTDKQHMPPGKVLSTPEMVTLFKAMSR